MAQHATFDCVICKQTISNRYVCSPRDHQSAPVCLSCSTLSSYDWTGRARRRTLPAGGTYRDRINTMTIAALADALAAVANQRKWSSRHGIA